MICLKVKGTFQQINDVLENHYPVRVTVRTFPNQSKPYYLTINESNDVTAKLIVDFAVANIIMMGVVKEREVKQLFEFGLTGL